MSEDLQRLPDGVPHDIVGRTLFASAALAALTLTVLAVAGWVAAVIVAVAASPLMVLTLRRKSDRERDHVHPSR